MPVSFVKEVLADGKPAIRVDGHPDSPLRFRVRMLDRDLRYGASGEPPELLVKVMAYQVGPTGATVMGGEGPILRQSITAESLALGPQSMLNERISMSRGAIRKALRGLTDMGAVVQMSSELVD